MFQSRDVRVTWNCVRCLMSLHEIYSIDFHFETFESDDRNMVRVYYASIGEWRRLRVKKISLSSQTYLYPIEDSLGGTRNANTCSIRFNSRPDISLQCFFLLLVKASHQP